MKNRAERRATTEKIANRRLKEVNDCVGLLEPYEEAGFFKKKNPFTFPKVPKREWTKLQKQKKAVLKAKRRNSAFEPIVEESE